MLLTIFMFLTWDALVLCSYGVSLTFVSDNNNHCIILGHLFYASQPLAFFFFSFVFNCNCSERTPLMCLKGIIFSSF